MKTKILILGLILLTTIFCQENIENPYSPEVSGNPSNPVDPAYNLEITMGVNANPSTFSNDNDYATFYLRFVGINAGYFSIANEQPINSITKILTVIYIEEQPAWGENASFQLFQAGDSVNLTEFSGYCWLKITPISEEIIIEPALDSGNTVDANGEGQIPFNGWELKEYKAIHFKISKK